MTIMNNAKYKFIFKLIHHKCYFWPLAIYRTFIIIYIVNTYKWNKELFILDENIIKSGQKTAANKYVHM